MGEMADYYDAQDERKIDEGMLPTCAVHEGEFGRWLDPMNVFEHVLLIKRCPECRGKVSKTQIQEFEDMLA